MSDLPPANLVASVAARLRNHARASGEDFQFVLIRYGLERLLYRLGESAHGNKFLLKGALLFLLWKKNAYRPTKDLDLMSPDNLNPETLQRILQEVGEADVVSDGLVFNPGSVHAEVIREDNIYGGIRVTLLATLGRMRIPLQVDIGFADSVTLAATEGHFPTILDFPAPTIRAYPPETVVAEKFEAMVKLGMANSRMKDFYDLWILGQDFEFTGSELANAIKATFERRGAKLPASAPIALTQEFFGDSIKLKQWEAFGKRTRIDNLPPIDAVASHLDFFLMPLCRAVLSGERYHGIWKPGGPWKKMNPSSG